MRQGMECLLDLLAGQSAGRPIHEAEWEAALTLAEAEHVLPWAVARLRSRQTPLTPALAHRLKQIERDAAFAAFYWSEELKGILSALDQQDIVVVPLKGPFLAERLYGSPPLRVSYDLDLLVSKSNLIRAEGVLAALGFIPATPDDYHRQWHRKGTVVELHHDVDNPLAFNFHVESALRQVQLSSFQGQRCWQLDPADELLFLCLHAVRHRFERLSLIVDLVLAFQQLSAGADAHPPRPEVSDLDSLLILGLAMARHLQPNLKVNLAGPPDQVAHLEGLADRLWNQMVRQPSETLDWRTLHQFYVEMELPGRPRILRRLRHARILLGRVIEPDYKFAANLGFQQTWQVRMLRPLRLLSDLVRH